MEKNSIEKIYNALLEIEYCYDEYEDVFILGGYDDDEMYDTVKEILEDVNDLSIVPDGMSSLLEIPINEDFSIHLSVMLAAGKKYSKDEIAAATTHIFAANEWKEEFENELNHHKE